MENNLNKIPIPVPSTERIKYVVSVLDCFNALCNDIAEGIPTEIEARQKQFADLTREQPVLMVAEEPAPYGETKTD